MKGGVYGRTMYLDIVRGSVSLPNNQGGAATAWPAGFLPGGGLGESEDAGVNIGGRGKHIPRGTVDVMCPSGAPLTLRSRAYSCLSMGCQVIAKGPTR